MMPYPVGTEMEVSMVVNMVNCNVCLSFRCPVFSIFTSPSQPLTYMHSFQMNVPIKMWLIQTKRSFVNTCMNISEAARRHDHIQRSKIREFIKAASKSKRNASPAKVLLPELMARIASHLSGPRFSDFKSSWSQAEFDYMPFSNHILEEV
jgi:hypothetical protein